MNKAFQLKFQATEWKRLFAVSVWLAAIIGSVLTFNLEYALGDNTNVAIAILVQVVFAALIAVAFSYASSRLTSLAFRRVLVVGFAVLALVAFFVFSFLRASWTCPYATNHELVVGQDMSEEATQYFRSVGVSERSCSYAIAEFAGDTARIWDANEIRVRFFVLAAVYCSAWFALAAMIVGATSLVTAPAARRKAPTAGDPGSDAREA
jgi:hypothetical protein